MSQRLCFFVKEDHIEEKHIEFVYVNGLAFSQKVKCAASLQKAIKSQFPLCNPLEVSTKSSAELGKSLSAFNLKLGKYFVESIFQSSKVFEGNVQFKELILKEPREAKKFIQENGRGPLICFRLKGKDYPLSPKSAFYDWVYITALSRSPYAEEVTQYDVFSDIEFNDKKSINCQARAAALFVLMKKAKTEEKYMSSFEDFVRVYSMLQTENVSLF